MAMDDRKNEFLQRYVTPGDPVAFSGRGNVAREFGINTDEANRELLSYAYSYPLHREYKRPKYLNPYFSYYPRQQVQCDLIDIQKLAVHNDNVKYLLVCIDIFTRKAWVRPLKTKQGKENATALNSILTEMTPIYPKTIQFDRGTEFLNNIVRALLLDRNIQVVLPSSENKAAYAERFNKSLQVLIYSYLTDRQTYRYIDVLQDLVKTYNSRKHRGHNNIYSPNEAEQHDNIDKVRQIQMNRRSETIIKGRKMKPKFQVGDRVRIYLQKKTFARAYKEGFSIELFEIVDIRHRMPVPTYTLKSMNNDDIIIGGFYANELQLFRGDVYRIERIIGEPRRRRGRREVLVKWQGFDDRHNSWIPEADVLNMNI
jgi:hypothetical protein